MQNALIQAAALFILMMIGALCGKLKYCDAAVRRSLSNILLFVTTPAMILEAFQFEYSSQVLVNMGIVAAVSTLVMIGSYFLSKYLFRNQPEDLKRVLIYAVTFANTGFLGLPLMQGLLGEIGVIYASVYVATFNILTWTLGVHIWTGEKASVKKVLTNVTLISVVIGVVMFCFSLRFPRVLEKPISMLSACNGPMSMIVVGAILSECSLKDLLGDKMLYGFTGLRLLAIPLATLILCRLLRLPMDVSAVLVLVGGTPTAVNTAIFATRYHGRERFASLAVALSTLLYLPVVPLWTWLLGF